MGHLNATAVKNAKPGRHIDGQGLYLLVKPSGARSWVLRVQKDGWRRDFGLGSVLDSKPHPDIAALPLLQRRQLTLAEARDKAIILRQQVRAGVDLQAEKKKARKTPSFKEATLACHATLKRGWTDRHAEKWLSAFEAYVFPAMGDKPVDQVDAPVIRDMLTPIWHTIPNTARRVRQRVGTVLDYAMAEKWREEGSPTRALGKILGPHSDKAKHMAAAPYAELPALLEKIRTASDSLGRAALMFTILTAARSGEVRSMVWSEVDLDAALWTVPAHKMKGRREHVVPLSGAAEAILRQMAGLFGGRPDEPVFPGRGSKPLSERTMLHALREAGCAATVHGFRSSFRDWAAEEANFNDDVIEASLAHANPNATERAYKRTTFFDKRRKLMAAWADYLAGASNVVRLAAAQ